MRLPIPWADYSSTRIDESLQRTVNMYPHSKRGYRQHPGTIEFGTNYGLPTYNQTESLPNTIRSGGVLKWAPTGLKFFDSLGAKLLKEFTVSTAWDISTRSASATASFTFVYAGVSDPLAIFWGDSGTKLYVIESTAVIYQHTASSAYDVTSLSYASKLYDAGNEVTAAGDFILSSDGDKVYIIDISTDQVYQYDLGTAWDISTASFVDQYDPSTEMGTELKSISISDDDSTIFLGAGAAGVTILQSYAMSSGDITTLTAGVSLDTAPTPTGNGVQFWGNSGFSLYLSAPTKKVEQWDVPAAFTLSGGTLKGRNGKVMDGIPYIVAEGFLYSVASDGTLTRLGAITGTGRVGMETDGVQLVVTSGTTIYRYTVANGLDTVTDGDIEDTAKTSAYIDLKFYFDQADGKFIGSSSNDATTFSTDDIAEAESFADDNLAMYAHNEFLYAMGANSIEPNRSVGSGRPPVERQVVIERGIIGSFAINSIDDAVYFVDQFTRPNMMSGLNYTPIYTPALAEEWATYIVGAALLAGVVGDDFSTPDSTDASIVSDITLMGWIAPDDWTPSTEMAIVSKYLGTNSKRSYNFFLDTTGKLELIVSANGAYVSGNDKQSSTATGFADGTGHWVRVTWVASTGVMTFYTSDDPQETSISNVSWTALGSSPAGTTATSILDSTADVLVGASEPGEEAQMFTGKIGQVAIVSGTDATVTPAAHFDPSLATAGAATFTAATGEVWTINGNASATATADCFVLSYNYNQQNFVEVTFPTQDVSWTYHVNSGQWGKREDTSNGRARAVAYMNAYTSTIVLNRSGTKLLQYSETSYQDDGSSITRTKDTAIITSEVYGDPALEGRNMALNSLWVTFQTTGTSSVDVSIAKDLSTFTTPRTITVASGRSTVKLTAWGKFREAILRFSTTSNTGVDIVDIAGDFGLLEG